MTGKAIIEFDEITSVTDDDVLVGVDVSDKKDSDGGTTKCFTKGNLLKEVNGKFNDYATLNGVETLTNKTLTNPDITGGSIDGSTNVVEVLKKVYPVGCIYTSTVGTNPEILFGFGSWSPCGEGRVLVGKASSGTFDTAGATGGEETHLHGLSLGSALIGSPTGNADALGFRRTQIGSLSDSTYSVGGTGHSASGHPNRAHNTRLDGTTDNGSSLPPYWVVYFFKRDS